MRNAAFCCLLLACIPAAPAANATVPALALQATDGKTHDLRADFARAPATVLVFFDPHCPCMAAHEPRLKALYDELSPRGVQWFMVDSETGATVARDQGWVSEHGLVFPMLTDEGAKLARAMGAQYASYAVVVDPAGRVVYAGGIDNERSRLSDQATPYLHDALTDILAGNPPRRAEGEALGCALALY